MENSGRFTIGHTETPEEKAVRVKGMVDAWKLDPRRHGMMNTKFYNSWRSMTTRCRGTAGKESKKKYLNKGITVCDRWKNFKLFYEDMYPSYVEGLTIDRIDNSKGYFKDNCRWATPVQQSNNTSKTVFIEYAGLRLSFRGWAEKLGTTVDTIKLRYYKKLPIEQILSKPRRITKRSKPIRDEKYLLK